MKTIYRAAFTLDTSLSNDDLMDCASALTWKWLFDPKRLRRLALAPLVDAPISARSSVEQEVLPGWRVQTHRVTADEMNAWGFRLTHPDADDHDLAWAVEMTVAVKKGQTPHFTCSSSIIDRGNVLRPIRRRPSRPGIVADVLDQIGGRSVFPLVTKPLDLSESDKDCDTLVQVLLSDKRTHPLVLISVDNASQQPLVEPLKVASHLAGLAHVVLARNSDVTWKLRGLIPNQLNGYHGAIRLYWPGFQFTDPSYLHPLWPPETILKYGGVHRATTEVTLHLLESISSIASFKVPKQYVTWDQVLELERRKVVAEAKQQAMAESEASGKTTVWAKMLEEDNAQQISEIRSLRGQLAAQAEETERQRSIAESFRYAFQLKGREVGSQEKASLPHSLPPDSVANAVLNAERDHKDKLAFAFNNKSEHKDSPFLASDEVERALNWLASSYWNARSGQQSCPDLDKSAREAIPGWSFSGGQKKHSVGKHESWYTCIWNGKTYWIGEHMGCGTSKRPEETIRIAFDWDDEQKRVIIGFIGQHQRNSNT